MFKTNKQAKVDKISNVEVRFSQIIGRPFKVLQPGNP
jgi:hypothetical protein